MLFFEKLADFNRRWNDIPRRIFAVVFALICAFLLGKIFPYIAPLVIGAVLAWLITPVAKLFERSARRIRLSEKVGAVIATLLVYAVIIALIVLLGARIVEECRSFIRSAPGHFRNISVTLEQWQLSGDLPFEIGNSQVMAIVNSVLSSLLNKAGSLVSSVAPKAALWAVDTVLGLPEVILFVVLTIMSSVYMVADRRRIFAFGRRWLPEAGVNRLVLLKNSTFRAVGGQIKCALILMGLVSVVLFVGFSIIGVPYPLLFGVVVAILDALPVLGVGLFLIPGAIVGFFTGNLMLGLGCLVLYGAVIVLRQIVEPKVVSFQLGLYPLLTMASMYAGLKFIGFAGLLVGPILAMIIKVMLLEDSRLHEKTAVQAETADNEQTPASKA